jgi:hypothetical protein
MFRQWAGAVNAVCVHAQFSEKKEKVIMVVPVVLALNTQI